MSIEHAGKPAPDTAVPEPLREFAAGRPLTLVWLNEAQGLTAWVRDPLGDLFAKWQPFDDEISLAREAERLTWLNDRHPAPRVVEYRELSDGELLVTAAIPAASAVDEHWAKRPEVAVRAIAEGLRLLHALDPTDCPFDWSVPTRIASAADRGLVVPADLQAPPPVDRLVVCHGDACSPNTLLHADGRFAATVDVGTLGTADRWADLAVASMALGWNYGPGWDELFFESYGVQPDSERITYYRALWNTT